MTRGRNAVRCLTVLATGAALAVVPALSAHASTITLPACGAGNVFNVTALIVAIEDANDESTHPGADTIEFAPNCVYDFWQEYDDSGNVLPAITSPITFNGHGATIQRRDPNSATGDPGAGAVGLFNVNSSGDLIVNHLTLANGAGHGAAGFVGVAGYLLMVDSRVTDSQFGNDTSALTTSSGGTMTLIRVTMDHNHLDTGNSGAAIRNAGSLYVYDSAFTNNGTFSVFAANQGNGGAVSNNGYAEIWRTSFTGNSAGATGGAITNSADLHVNDSTFETNHALHGGAIRSSSDLVVDGSYFGTNSSGDYGGAVDNGGIAQVYSSTFDANHSSFAAGGAIENTSTLRVERSTFADNTAKTSGQAIDNATDAFARVEANIVKGAATGLCGGAGTWFDFGDNLAYPDAGGCPSGFAVGDPKLAAPAMRGGSTKTMDLGPGSAAVDRIASCSTGVDQRDYTRPAGGACDVGAYEDQPPGAPGAPFLATGSAVNNTGIFTLDWTDATDPDGDALTYTVLHRDYDDAADSAYTGATEAEGTWRYRAVASDGNHSTASGQSAAVTVDKSAPTGLTAAADRAPDVTTATGSWYGDTVTVTFSGATDPALADTSKGSGIDTIPPAVTYTTSGSHTASGHATDYAGNASSPDASLTVAVDADAPLASFGACPATALLHSATTLSWSASDAESGLVTPASGSIPVDTTTVGTRTLSTTATDAVGHSTTATCVVQVVYDFTGFFAPLVNPPGVYTASAGGVVPVAFGLAGNQGLGVFAAGFPVSVATTCGTNPALTTGTATAGANPGLKVSGKPARYTYYWKTSSAWKGTCRQLVLRLADGTYHRANLRFT
jgi:hypothetical protein